MRLLAAALMLVSVAVHAQELEPRAFSPGPAGLNIALASLGYSSGDLVFDSSIPIEGATADIRSLGAGYQRFFGLFGQTAKFAALIGVADCNARGTVQDMLHERHFRGLTDPRIGMSWIFYGAPAMTPRQYALYKPGTLAGFSLAVSPPIGQYDKTKLLNAGTNRWTLRTQLGAARYQGRWTLEGTLGASFFADNHEYFPGNATQSQNPITSLQLHCGYTIKPQMWIAAGATYYRGGGSAIDDIPRPGFQSNSRYGITASFPLPKRQSLQVNYSRGLITRTGSNYDTAIVGWGIRWF